MAAGAITAILVSIPPMALVSGIPTNTTLRTAASTGPRAWVNSNSPPAVRLRQPHQQQQQQQRQRQQRQPLRQHQQRRLPRQRLLLPRHRQAGTLRLRDLVRLYPRARSLVALLGTSRRELAKQFAGSRFFAVRTRSAASLMSASPPSPRFRRAKGEANPPYH